jgi:hypothetical protein
MKARYFANPEEVGGVVVDEDAVAFALVAAAAVGSG